MGKFCVILLFGILCVGTQGTRPGLPPRFEPRPPGTKVRSDIGGMPMPPIGGKIAVILVLILLEVFPGKWGKISVNEGG